MPAALWEYPSGVACLRCHTVRGANDDGRRLPLLPGVILRSRPTGRLFFHEACQITEALAQAAVSGANRIVALTALTAWSIRRGSDRANRWTLGKHLTLCGSATVSTPTPARSRHRLGNELSVSMLPSRLQAIGLFKYSLAAGLTLRGSGSRVVHERQSSTDGGCTAT